MRRLLATIVAVPLLAAGLGVASVVTASPAGAASPGDLVINEIMQNPAAVADGSGEWFEILNVSAVDVDIEGWTIQDAGSDTHVINNGAPLVVPAGGFVVLGNNADTGTNGGAPVDYSYGSSWFIANGDDEIILSDDLDVEIDRVEYDGGPTFPDPSGASMSLDPAAATATDNDDGSNWCEATTPYGAGDLGTPGSANPSCGGVEPPTAALIHEIQGNGPTVAITGGVSVTAIVTSFFESGDALDGFFLQEEDADADADPATSEGIFVFCRGNCPAGLAVGDQVTVEGTAEEFFGMSQIDASAGTVTINSSDYPLPTVTPLTLPAPGPTDIDGETTFEPYEAMLVEFTDQLVVSEYFELARFGQVVLTLADRPYQFTHGNAPSVPGYAAFLDDLATRQIILDDDNNDQNDALGPPDEPYYYPEGGLSTGNFFRGGDSITGLAGVLHWSWAGFGGTDAWRVRPVPEVYDYTFTSENPRPASPVDPGGSVTVASFNVLNYFTTIDEGGATCGPSALECRGADSAAELERQRDKIIAALAELDADVVGLIEIENDASASVADLVAGLNSVMGAGTYDYVDTGAIGTDAIKVAFMYQPATVTAVGDFAVLDSSVDPTFIDTLNRPVLIQTFEEVATGERLTVAVNHLKSKGSDCDDVGDPDVGDGQGNCNLTRESAATALANYLASDPTGSGDPDFLIIGDLNSYAMEDPIAALQSAGYTDLINLFSGSDAYSFVFDSQLGYLDHGLANEALVEQVTGVTEWHVNADEVPVFDYNDGVQDSSEASFERESNATTIYSPDPFRSSDHDPLVIGLDLETVFECAGERWTVEALEAAGYNVILGDESDNELVGTNAADAVFGFGGADTIDSRNGDDLVCGGEGGDAITAANGADTVDSGPGDDSVLTGNGNDIVFAGPGADTVDTGNGADQIDGGDGDDSLVAGPGDDFIDAGDGVDTVFGNQGFDTCVGGEVVFGCEA